LGRWWPHLLESAAEWLDNTPWSLQGAEPWPAAAQALPPGLEAVAIALGLLAPCLLALSVALAVGGVAALMGLGFPLQLTFSAAAGLIGTIILRRMKTVGAAFGLFGLAGLSGSVGS
jgi:hypothetical protein